MTRQDRDQTTEDNGVKETLADDGRHIVYSLDLDGDDPADTDEWISSDTIISGSDCE